MHSTPTFSVLIPWADRPQIREMLARNRPWLERHDIETVIVNGGGDGEALRELVSDVPEAGVRIISTTAPVFNRSQCFNIGALASRGTVLFILDADIVFQSDVLGEAAELMRNGRRFVAIGRVVETDPSLCQPPGGPDLSFLAEAIDQRTLITTDGRRAVLRNRRLGGARASDGLVLIEKQHFVDIGGFNSELVGWGYEDTDFQLRLQFGLGLERVDVGEVLHLSHPATARSQESWNRNMMRAFGNYARGQYLGTLEHDRSFWDPGSSAAVGGDETSARQRSLSLPVA
jgi:GT2 family glycosyltransferase